MFSWRTILQEKENEDHKNDLMFDTVQKCLDGSFGVQRKGESEKTRKERESFYKRKLVEINDSLKDILINEEKFEGVPVFHA